MVRQACADEPVARTLPIHQSLLGIYRLQSRGIVVDELLVAEPTLCQPIYGCCGIYVCRVAYPCIIVIRCLGLAWQAQGHRPAAV